MQIDVEDNPNCRGSEQFVFQELSEVRPLEGLLVTERGEEVPCDVAGVSATGEFIEARCVKIADSGAGYAFLIYGGAWGIRLRKRSQGEPWDFKNTGQWGEAFKIYGNEEDLIFKKE